MTSSATKTKSTKPAVSTATKKSTKKPVKKSTAPKNPDRFAASGLSPIETYRVIGVEPLRPYALPGGCHYTLALIGEHGAVSYCKEGGKFIEVPTDGVEIPAGGGDVFVVASASARLAITSTET